MSRLTYIGVTVLVLVASAAIVSWSLKSGPSKQATPTVTQSTPSVQKIGELPVDPANNKIVKSMGLKYVFGATLRSVNKNNPQKPWLSTNLNEEQGVPRFYITNSTKFFLEDKNKKNLPATINDLVPKQRLWITAEYNTSKKTWKTTKVVIKRGTSSPQL